MVHSKLTSSRWRTRGAFFSAVAVALTGASLPAAAAGGPSLGAARSYAALAGSTVTSTGQTVITGDVGVSPGTDISGIPPATVTGAVHAGDVAASRAHADAALAYEYLAGMASIPANLLTGTDLGGLTLAPGVYKFDTAAQLTGDLKLDAQGDSGALFVFQIGTTLTTGTGAKVLVINGGADYDESNVFWQVGTSATLGTNTAFTGNILANASIALVTGASMTGNALALTGAVTLDSNVVTSPAPGAGPVPVPGAPLAPINLTAVRVGPILGTGYTLSFTDTSDNETGFRVFRRDGAGPEFVLVGTVTGNGAATGATISFTDELLGPSTTYTYRVTAFSSTAGESVPSNEARVGVQTGLPAPPRRLDLSVGRGRSLVRDQIRLNKDRVFVRESYTVIDTATGVPAVLANVDPRIDGVTIQVRAPGNIILVAIAANDPRWRALKGGIYTWRTRNGKNAPMASFRINTRKHEFTFTSDRNDFGAVPQSGITVSFSYLNAAGSDARIWNPAKKLPRDAKAVFSLAR